MIICDTKKTLENFRQKKVKRKSKLFLNKSKKSKHQKWILKSKKVNKKVRIFTFPRLATI